MKRRFLVILLEVTLSTLALAQTSNSTIDVCVGSTIPYGYVIIGTTTTEQCRSYVDLPERDNTLVIKRPGPREVICEHSPYPSNYAVVARARSVNCPNNTNENYNNAQVIERVK